MRIIVLFNLRPQADAAAYEQWARTRDIPGVRSLESVAEFEVYRTTGLVGADNSPPYRYVEVIDVKSFDQFGADVGSEAVQRLAKEFQEFAQDPLFITTEKL